MEWLRRLICRWQGHTWLSYEWEIKQATNGMVYGHIWQICTVCRVRRRLILSTR
jgi:hypothetical protein